MFDDIGVESDSFYDRRLILHLTKELDDVQAELSAVRTASKKELKEVKEELKIARKANSLLFLTLQSAIGHCASI